MQDDTGREARIVQLVGLAGDQGIPAVCRVIRYERSLPVAKTAALRLLQAKAGQVAKGGPGRNIAKGPGYLPSVPGTMGPRLVASQAGSRRLPSSGRNCAAEEEGLLLRQPRDTSLAVVEGLLRFQIAACGRSIAMPTPPSASKD